MSSREAVESPVRQGEDESIAYSVTTTPWASSPTGATCALKRISSVPSADLSSTNLSGSVSTNGDVITSPLVTGLSKGEKYRLEFQFQSGGNTYEVYVVIYGER